MGDFKPIETIYNGYRFRSRLEARWAVFFDALGIKYEYEPEGFVLSDGTHYLPDFYLPQFDCYMEIKRKELDFSERKEAERKISDGMKTDTWAGIICYGDPYDHELRLFCQEYNDSSGGSYEGNVVIGLMPDTQEPMLFAWSDTRDRTFISTFKKHKEILVKTDTNYEYLDNPYVTQRVIDAELKARQARFEHGETPTI